MVNTRRTPTSRKSHHKEFIHKAVEHYQEMSLGIRVSTEAMCDDGFKQK